MNMGTSSTNAPIEIATVVATANTAALRSKTRRWNWPYLVSDMSVPPSVRADGHGLGRNGLGSANRLPEVDGHHDRST